AHSHGDRWFCRPSTSVVFRSVADDTEQKRNVVTVPRRAVVVRVNDDGFQLDFLLGYLSHVQRNTNEGKFA
uniref:Uncharacterized protein n=1 Tax=Romanomermis culicivorax TaxID=13658 RepID=A0A915HTJ4_ROMCU